MRHEAKLNVIKHSAYHGNFKNICYTITKRSLHALCLHLNSRESFLMVNFEVSNVSHEIELDNESTALRNFA